MRKSKLEQIREAKKAENKQVETDLEGLLRLILNGEPNPTQRSMIYDPARIVAYMGPAGCAKTSTLAASGLLRALFQPGSKGFVSRNDYNDLMDTTKQRFEEMLYRLPKGILLDRTKAPPEKWVLRPVGLKRPDGSVDDTPSQITFMGVKDDIVGVEANWWLVDEANEVAEVRIHQILMRMRAAGGNYAIRMAFNPPDKHHWLYTACTGRDFQDRTIKEPWIKLYRPQNRENIRNLPAGYYEEKAATLPDDQRQRYVDGEWGSSFDGAPVFREFNYGWHVKDNLGYDPELALFRFWDFGYTRPFCGWAQMTFEGQLRILAISMGHNIEIKPWAEKCKAITQAQFPNAKEILDFGDPAVRQRKDTGSALSHLYSSGIQMRYKQDVGFEESARLLRQRLTTVIEGEPAIQFNRRTCSILIDGLRGGYHLDNAGKLPVKDGYYDHGVDALRYLIANLFHGAGESTIATSRSIPDTIEYNPDFDHGSR